MIISNYFPYGRLKQRVFFHDKCIEGNIYFDLVHTTGFYMLAPNIKNNPGISITLVKHDYYFYHLLFQNGVSNLDSSYQVLIIRGNKLYTRPLQTKCFRQKCSGEIRTDLDSATATSFFPSFLAFFY